MTRLRSWLAVALGADLVGAAAVLLLAGRAWQHVVVTRQRPLPAAMANLSGRDLHAAITAFALIALAGMVAIAATKTWGRQLVGVALVGCGAVIGWYALGSLAAVSADRARAAIASGVGIDASSRAQVTVNDSWPLLTAASALFIAIAGALTLAFARRWSALASRYDAPTAAAQADRNDQGGPAGDDIAMWRALDRGDDPTTRTES